MGEEGEPREQFDLSPLAEMRAVQTALKGLYSERQMDPEGIRAALEKERELYGNNRRFEPKARQLGKIITAFDEGKIAVLEIFRAAGIEETLARERQEERARQRRPWFRRRRE